MAATGSESEIALGQKPIKTWIDGFFGSIWMYRLIRFALGGIFLWSGTNKLLEPQVFAVLIEAYGLVPDSLLMPIAIFLPILEVIAGLALMLDIRGSLATIGGLLIIFVTILGYGIHLGLDVDCGCFGPEDPEAKAYHGLRAAVYRDMLMMAGVFYLYAWRILRPQPPIRVKNIIYAYLLYS